jgi:glycosyltransferase involved in cell wall biosynthesis
MKISIITATFNSSKTILDCINTVNNQTFADIEHIIVDGASNDDTVKLIESAKSRVKLIISEPDTGIFHAMNKGISKANGDIIGILNSDDVYFDNTVVERVIEVFKMSQTDCVYGDLFYVDKSDTSKIVRHWKTSDYKYGSFRKGWHPAHPSLFLRSSVYQKYGDFDLSFDLASDFELMLRMFEVNRISSAYLPFPLVKMRLGGASNKNMRSIFDQNIKCIQAFRKNGLAAGFLYPLYRLAPKIIQYFR